MAITEASFVDLLTRSEAAQRLGRTYVRIIQLERAGRLRTVRTPLGTLVMAGDVERLLRERRERERAPR